MLLKRLIISKTYPEYEIIRDVQFKMKGLNLIIDNTTNSPSDSGNNIGKTTFIKIIDLCLGAKSVKSIYYDSDTKTDNEIIKDFLNKNKVEARLDVIDENKNIVYTITRQLFNNGNRMIDGEEYKKDEFLTKLKEIIFYSNKKYPTLRELMPKFIRIDSSNTDNIIKFLGNFSKNHQYDTIYQFLFNILDDTLIDEKNSLNNFKNDCDKKIKILENDRNIASLDVLKQKYEIISAELKRLFDERKKLDYINTYKAELDKKRNLTLEISKYEKELQLIDFDIELLQESIDKLKQEYSNVDINKIKEIYNQAKLYIQELEKKFEDVVEFHNTMIENRISFLNKQLLSKNINKENLIKKRNELLEEKQKITIDLLDEGLLTDLNVLNTEIERLTLEKGEVAQSIKILEESENERQELETKISTISKALSSDSINEKISEFNKYFTKYSEIVYGEKYFFAYNSNWKNQKTFPVTISNFKGNVGTGMKKGMITVFDLAYLEYSYAMKINNPKFIIHDKLETTHINQLKTIFEICETINGQYIVPILRERISKIDTNIVEKSKILELSKSNKLFGI